MSNEYKEYLKKINNNKLFIKITRIIFLFTFLILWEILSRNNIINNFIYSSPSKIISTIINLYEENNLFNNIFITLYETIISFSLATILGIIIASILWYCNNLYKVIEPILTIINSLPKVSLGPIIIILFGANIKSIIIMALLISLINTIINIYTSFIQTDPNKIKLMKSLYSNKFKIFLYLILPSNYKTIISSLKINISMSLIGVIMGELLVSKSGIGYLIMYGSQIFNLNLVYSGIFLLTILSYLIYLIIIYIEKILIKSD